MPNSFNINKYPKTKKYVSLYFHVHQPYRLNNIYSPFVEIPNLEYFGGPEPQSNSTILNRVADLNYKPAGEMFLELAETTGLKIAYSFTGTVLQQLQDQRPDVLDIYRELHSTGKMELICETYYHSLAAFYDPEEFIRQILLHRDKFIEVFDAHSMVFRNTEFTYRNDVGEIIREMGFKAMYTEGWDKILDWRSPTYMYHSKPVELTTEQKQAVAEFKHVGKAGELKLLLKNYKRSDDVAFRFQLKGWEGYPVTADKFAKWVAEEPGYLTNLCMDYETIGEHHKADSGIFEFYRHLPEELAKQGVEFILPGEAADAFDSEEELDFPDIVSWADAERDLSAWTGNEMQQASLDMIYQLAPAVKDKLARTDDIATREHILDTWGKLQTSDHYYYMSTKYWGDGDVHRYFSPYESPFQGNSNFLNAFFNFREYLVS